VTKTDARPVTITYAYDQLNRNTTVEYSNTTNISPDIVRQYDYAVNGKGKFLRQYAYSYAYGPLTIEYEAADSYDAMGRLTQQGQSFYTNGTWSSTFTSSVTYDLAGNVTSQTYPSNRTVNYAYDAAGRTTSFTGNLGDGVSRNYATAMQYTAAGQLAKETFGTTTPLYQRFNYNVRQQLFAVRVGTNGSSAYDNNPQGDFQVSRLRGIGAFCSGIMARMITSIGVGAGRTTMAMCCARINTSPVPGPVAGTATCSLVTMNMTV
jgi:YD repeat-containing protein